jgi:hypothetical protein
MKTLSTLKTLPLVGLLAMGLALVPAVSMADKNNHGHGKDKTHQSYDGGKSHHGVHNRSHYVHRHHKHHKHGGHKHVYVHGHNHHVRHVYRPGHKHHGHRHTNYVVVHDHHDDYDPFRLMLGLHFDNIDIIYRDF